MIIFKFTLYTLILSYSPCDVFKHFNVTEMHGLNLVDCEKYINTNKDAYIAGFCNVSPIDGKQFDFNKNFAYQTLNADTQVLVFDDVEKSFNFESLFSIITEGITIEKKNKDAIKIPVSRSPKICLLYTSDAADE